MVPCSPLTLQTSAWSPVSHSCAGLAQSTRSPNLPCLPILCRFGTEHEKLGYFVDSHRRIDHEAISKLLHQICTRFSWQPIMEKGNIIGATLENASVTLEPGGQFELSGAPLDSLHKTCSEVNSHLYEAGAPCNQ